MMNIFMRSDMKNDELKTNVKRAGNAAQIQNSCLAEETTGFDHRYGKIR